MPCEFFINSLRLVLYHCCLLASSKSASSAPAHRTPATAGCIVCALAACPVCEVLSSRLPWPNFRFLHASLRTVCTLALLGATLFAQQAPPPKPDPAGIATGDKSAVVDAGGTPFVPPEPTDKAAPDYEKNKKQFDEFQSQAAKEPLTMKLADSVGHLRIGTNFAWTLNLRLSRLVHAGRLRSSHLWPRP